MNGEVAVTFDDQVWHDVLRSPAPSRNRGTDVCVGSPRSRRSRHHRSARVAGQAPSRHSRRMRPAKLKQWLEAVAGAPGAAASLAIALDAVREGLVR
jgi:hypothetical protein